MSRIIEEMVEKQSVSKAPELTYNITSVYVGYLAKHLVWHEAGRTIELNRLIDRKPRMFKYSALGVYQDIESGKYYPMLKSDDNVADYDLYIAEEYCKRFDIKCSNVITSESVTKDSKLTAEQLRNILDKQFKVAQFGL